MPVNPTYPGVYIEDGRGVARTISGVPTSDTAFVDVFEKGPVNKPTKVANFGQFTSTFGPLNIASKASYGIFQFFQNGGTVAWVVRLQGHDRAATATGLTADVGVDATGPGEWGNDLQIATQPAADGGFDLVVRELSGPIGDDPSVIKIEIFAAVSAYPTMPNYVGDVIDQQSSLVTMGAQQPRPRDPGAAPDPGDSILNPLNYGDVGCAAFTAGQLAGGEDGLAIDGAATLGAPGDPSNGVPATGMYNLGQIAPHAFNILCIPAMSALSEAEWEVAYVAASEFCEEMRAFLIADPPIAALTSADAAGQVRDIQAWRSTIAESGSGDHAATYFPRIEIFDPVSSSPMETEASGTLAGIFSTTDASRGVWKAPAGASATLSNVSQPAISLTDADNSELNPLGINCLRTFPTYGTVSWGARTLEGADRLGSPWKYISVRRLALFVESSVFGGLDWVVFEPNDEALWSAVRLSVGSFLNGLYQQGAFQGSKASNAYYVRCDATTTSPSDVRDGRVNVTVGFAPVRPAEFVVLTISRSIPTSPDS